MFEKTLEKYLRKVKKRWCVFALGLLLFTLSTFSFAGTYTAASCSQSDVNKVINGPTHTAVDGDIINIPSGSCTWTSGVVVPSDIGITIAGSGTPNSGASTTGASSSCGSDTTLTLSPSGTTTAFTFAPEYGNSLTRLSCLNISWSSGPAIAFKILGVCTSSGCPNLRMDNITFSNWGTHDTGAGISYGIGAIGDMFGVVDHNTITGTEGNYLQLVEQSNASYLGVGSYGDNSWNQSEGYGSANFLFFENNSLTYAGLTENEGSAGGLTNQGGGRVVARYNTFTTDTLNVELAWHGTESSGRPRGTRTWDFNNNTINCFIAEQFCQAVVGARSGTGISWGNIENFVATSGTSSFENLDTYRTEGNPGASSWQGACDGSSAYDTNDGTTYYSGTIVSSSGGCTTNANTVCVSGTPWTVGEWAGSAITNGTPYSVHDVTASNGSEISASGTNSLTIINGGGPGQYTPTSGDSFQILRATKCIDQAGGRGAGILYSGSPASPASSADESSSPTYLWMNAFNTNTPGTVVYSNTARVIANRDFYTETANQGAQSSSTSPFNGTSGMGHGTLANRPTTCTVEVAYFATDSGSQGTLYLCETTNTWTSYYSPYTYPHPLDSGSGAVPPLNLTLLGVGN